MVATLSVSITSGALAANVRRATMGTLIDLVKVIFLRLHYIL